ncbi:uncharacterized protein LOC142171796 [Nicotiana tabacum]|uniref:Uncharacterized protein LOC142171796 n=1 Tax=Nicotiana tabacum TaxID=4097 RepID=A0AC58T2Z2_TOBAC
MIDYLQAKDYELWDMITDGLLSTLKKNTQGEDVPKTRVDCNADDFKNSIQGCSTAKKIWDTLRVAHERKVQVKRSRRSLLFSQYENIAMKDGETIQEMYTRFTTLTNELRSLGRIPTEE